MNAHSRLPIGIEHLAVLRLRGREVEPQPDALGSLRNGIAAVPTEIIDGATSTSRSGRTRCRRPSVTGGACRRHRFGYEVACRLSVFQSFAAANTACNRTLAPAVRSSGLASSASL